MLREHLLFYMLCEKFLKNLFLAHVNCIFFYASGRRCKAFFYRNSSDVGGFFSQQFSMMMAMP